MTTVALPRERWRNVHPGYQASNRGEVRSLDRVIIDSRGRRYRHRGRVLRQFVDKRGYRRVQLGGSTEQLVHRLVLLAWRGPCPPGLEACHLNDDKADNRLANLRWDSHSANAHDAVRNGRNGQASKTHCPRGHELVAPNLMAYYARRGHRNCLACSRAASNRHRPTLNAHVPFLLLADYHYGMIHIEAGLPLPEIDYNRGLVAS